MAQSELMMMATLQVNEIKKLKAEVKRLKECLHIAEVDYINALRDRYPEAYAELTRIRLEQEAFDALRGSNR